MYKTRKTSKPKRIHPLQVNSRQDIVNVDNAPILASDLQITFTVETKSKLYKLHAESRAAKAMWVSGFFGINSSQEVRRNPRLLKNEAARSITPIKERSWLHSNTTASSELPMRSATPLV
mmetsp:Transcript_26334/g.47249  ORF Transcript_26334/g.47249 Transcript_26334/m.47249 type:complete len:120 (+) Transcript_26334:146-505(+)